MWQLYRKADFSCEICSVHLRHHDVSVCPLKKDQPVLEFIPFHERTFLAYAPKISHDLAHYGYTPLLPKRRTSFQLYPAASRAVCIMALTTAEVWQRHAKPWQGDERSHQHAGSQLPPYQNTPPSPSIPKEGNSILFFFNFYTTNS